MKEIDARGRSCPEPVILTKKALERDGVPFEVLVDNSVAVDNISRFANSRKLRIHVSPEGEDFRLRLEDAL